MIRIPPRWLALMALSLSLPGQSYVTSPPGMLTKGGDSSWTLLGRTPAGRYLYLDGEMRGTKRQLKAVAMRRASIHAVPTSYARSWQRVRLRVGPTDLIATSTVFDRNFTGTPALVFDRAVRWPTFQWSTKLQPFGGAARELSFPFSSPYSFSGRTDLGLDFDFSGGTLANATTWSSVATPHYSLDAVQVAGKESKRETGVVHGTSCRDSAQTVDAGVSMSSVSYGLVGMRSSAWGRLDLQTFILPRHHHIGTDPFGIRHYRPSIHLLGVAGSAVGSVVPGIRCARLHIDLAAPTLQFAPYTYRGGYHGIPPQFRLPYNGRLAGQVLWYQAAWADSKTGQTLLTNVVAARVARLSSFVQRSLVFQPDPRSKASRGYLVYTTPAVVLRYRY